MFFHFIRHVQFSFCVLQNVNERRRNVIPATAEINIILHKSQGGAYKYQFFTNLPIDANCYS